MADEKNTEPPAGGPKKFSLNLPVRLPISTSQGTYFVRHLVTRDLPSFSAYTEHTAELQGEDYFAIGELALKTFTCLEEKSEKPAPLSDVAYAALSADDLKVLAMGIAEVGKLGPLADGPVQEAIGKLLLNRLRVYAKQAAESAAELKKVLNRSFGTISESTKASLADSLSGIATLRDSLRESSAVVALRKELELHNSWSGKLPKDFLPQVDVAKHFGLTSAAEKMSREIEEGTARQLEHMTKPAFKVLERHEKIGQSTLYPLNAPIYQPPPMAKTPLGRAAIAGEESARQLREVAGLAGQMTDKIANLSEVMLTKVLPEWFENLETSSKAANTNLLQAEKSVNLAKKAIIWSIVVTIAMTIWQLGVARLYKIENDGQQTTSETLLRQQLVTSQALTKQMAEDSKKLNEQLSRLSQALSKLPSTKADVAAPLAATTQTAN